MKELLEGYASYNLWANERLLNYSLKLEDQLWDKEIHSSFKSITETFFHIWRAEFVWWQRIKLAEKIEYPQPDEMQLPEVGFNLLTQSAKWKEWVVRSSEASLLHQFAYYNGKKEFFKSEVWKVIMHFCNHGSYHRGQMVSIFHQLDQKNIPPTDFILFMKEKQKK